MKRKNLYIVISAGEVMATYNSLLKCYGFINRAFKKWPNHCDFIVTHVIETVRNEKN